MSKTTITITIETEERPERGKLEALAQALRTSTQSLQHAVDANQPNGPTPRTSTESEMAAKPAKASPILQQLADAVTAATTVEASAVALINGFAAREQADIAKAIANGATAEELAPFQATADALKASAQALADAVTANTPAAP